MSIYRGSGSPLAGAEGGFLLGSNNEKITGVWTFGGTNTLAPSVYNSYDTIIFSDTNTLISATGVGWEITYNSYYDSNGTPTPINPADNTGWVGCYSGGTQVGYKHTDGKATTVWLDNDEVNVYVADTYVAKFGQGLVVSTATGTVFDIADKGPGSINCQSLYVNGVAVAGSAVYTESGTTATLTSGNQETVTVTHGLGTDNVKVEVIAKGQVYNRYSIGWQRPDGLGGLLQGNYNLSFANNPTGPASTGTVIVDIKNEYTGSQTITYQIIVTALD